MCAFVSVRCVVALHQVHKSHRLTFIKGNLAARLSPGTNTTTDGQINVGFAIISIKVAWRGEKEGGIGKHKPKFNALTIESESAELSLKPDRL